MRFRGRGFDRTVATPHTPYTMLQGDDFFERVLQELEEGAVDFSWGCSQVEISGRTVLASEREHNFDLVIDASFDPAVANSLLWQSFGGLWVETERDTFDPSTAILMDLLPSDTDSPVAFVYVLPLSAREALVEHTTFSVRPMSAGFHRAGCEEWLTTHSNGGYVVTRCEHGAIPMGLRVSQGAHGPRLGSIAGAIRPATGYAFLNIQRQARELAREIVHGGAEVRSPAAPFSNWYNIADGLFLKALARRPHHGSVLMGRLLERAPAEPLVRFLAGDAGLFEGLRVMSSVPKGPMVRALMGI